MSSPTCPRTEAREYWPSCPPGTPPTVVFLVAHLWTDGSPVAPCAGFAMVAAVVLSAGIGAVIPLSFRAAGIDPAVATGPLITTLNDILSLVIYFGVAGLLLRWNA